ncbi:MAG: DUF3800 domain-containing protein [Planctomycetes bacterium]|nr:DUF3800 domain-containing protein [Planctomycetota bacterium]
MKFEVYCDESRPDLLASSKPDGRSLVIGSLWLCADDRVEFKKAIHALRDKHRVGGEFKWQKVSPSRVEFYKELVQWFMGVQDRLRFRCIAVEHEKVNLVRYHDSDQELGFYKFYYQVLHHWIVDFNEYVVFCDCKKNRDPKRLHILRRCLDASNLSSVVRSVQAVPSSESVLIQLADVLTGIAAARLNGRLRDGSAKAELVRLTEKRLGRRIGPTSRAEPKFNVFVIDLRGGW